MRRSDYLLKRTAFAIVTIFVAITLNFFLFRVLPGNAITNIAHVPHSSKQLQAALTHEFGLDKPKWEQYLIYLKELGKGNLGISWANQQPVTSEIRTDLANTIPMLTLGTVLSILLGVGSGVIAAWRRGRTGDYGPTGLALLFYSFPTQWLGLMLVVLFASVLPVSGMSDPFLVDPTMLQKVTDILRHMILPSATVALTLYGSYALIVRSSMLETLGEDYVLTARAKGLSAWAIVRKHALRNAMLPMVTLIALSLGSVVGGFILVEVVFSWPGIGQAAYQAVVQRDYPMLQGVFLVLTISVVLFNLLADLVYFKLDPRVTE
ncbi:MAG TPA: ABC transporter permease [Streptosporangiaceae bacterium]|jgi:ABC-type dipeptide/oligopeptide/nickel transport system permease component|nr:ABC transporter permease [Streptosporangiaceae bacterium]